MQGKHWDPLFPSAGSGRRWVRSGRWWMGGKCTYERVDRKSVQRTRHAFAAKQLVEDEFHTVHDRPSLHHTDTTRAVNRPQPVCTPQSCRWRTSFRSVGSPFVRVAGATNRRHRAYRQVRRLSDLGAHEWWKGYAAEYRRRRAGLMVRRVRWKADWLRRLCQYVDVCTAAFEGHVRQLF